MNKLKRVLALLLCLAMVSSYLPMNVLAADGAANVTLDVDKTEVNVGDTVTVTVNYTDMEVSSFACTLKFDKNLLECTSIVSCDEEYPDELILCTKRGYAEGTAYSTTAQANSNGQVGFALAGTKDTSYVGCSVFTATFKAKATGAVRLALTEDSAGTDGFNGEADAVSVQIFEEAATVYYNVGGDVTAEGLEAGADLTDLLKSAESKEGHTFKGWSFYKDAEKQQSVTLDGNKMPAHDLYVFGNWEEIVPEYTLTFLNENGDVLKTYTYKNGWNETPAYPAYSKANHTITWSAEIPATLTKDMEITAIATPNTYVVTFYNSTTEVGTETADQSNDWKVTAIGGKEKEPDANSHYTFKGWGLSDGATNVQYEAGASITVTGKMDLYAVYTAAAHAEGDKKDHLCDECGYGISDCKDENPKDHKCDICGITMGDPHADGTDNDHVCDYCGGAVEGETCTPGTAVEENREEATCTTAGSYDSVVYCTECGEKISTTPVTIPATGHTFGDITAKVAATCKAGGNEAYKQCTVCKLYFAGNAANDATNGKESADAFATGVNADNHAEEIAYKNITETQHTEYYPCCGKEIKTENHTYVDGKCACDKVATYTITWVVEGQDNVTTTVAHGETPAYPNGTPTRAEDAEYSYTFAGWSPEITAAAEAKTYTATWNKDAKEYKLTIKLGDHGKMAGTNEYTYTGDYGSAVELPEIVMDEGWKIVSWTANFGGKDQTANALPTTMPAASGTYTAVWDKIDVTVQFNEGETNELTGKYFDKVTAPTLTKEGHTFLGWDDNNNADDTEVLYAGGAEITLDKNVPETLYAKWQVNTYTISFANTGDPEMQDKTVAYGESIGTIETPVKEGYTFTGWIITDAEGTEVTVADGKMPAKNLTYTAGWQIKSYTITWKDADGTTIDTTTVDHGEIPTHAEPTKESSEQYDYKFGGWSPEVVAATNNAEYTATFTSVTRSYDITFVVDGQENKVVSTKYGEKPVYDAEGKAPTKASDNQYSYTFAGWDKELVPVTGEATYTATWTKTPVEYTVTYMIEGEAEPYFFRKGGYDTAIDYTGFNKLPTKTGYTFNGWDVEELPTTFAAENVVINGSFSVNQYTITFMDGETEVSKFTDDYGAVITAPEVTMEGHMLTGWKDEDGNSFSTIPAENKTVYAQWQIQSYDVTWLIDDEVYTTTTVEYGAAITDPVPTRDGYEFMGWNVEIPETMPAEPVTITGSWKPIDYTIIFKVEGMEDQSITAPYGSDITEQVAAITATKEGYQFNCWMTEDNRCANLATMPLGNMTVTADFTINEYNINFFATEGDATALMTFEVEYGTVLNGAEDDPETEEDESKPDVFAELLAQVEAMDDPTKEGHTWKGWDTEDKIPETMPAYAVNIYGIWEVNSYTITADGQVYTFEYGEAVSIPNPTKEGHTFQGWNETVPTTMPAYDVVLTAKWEVNSYTITFDVEGEAYKEITAPYGTEIEWPENPANIPGHTFAGWSTDGVTVIENLPETMPVNGLNLKAVWQKNTVYITWKVEGKQDDVVEYKYGDAITIPADPTKAADAEYTYKFTGWTPEVPETATESKAYTAQFEQDEKVKYDFHFKNDEEVVFEGTIAWGETIDLSAFDAPTKEHNTLSWTLDGAEVTFPYEMPAKEVTFVAQWTPETYTITIDGGEPVTYAYGAAISIENPTKEGHTFQGWKKDGVEGYYTLPETMPAENIVITSDWKVNEYTLSVSSYDAEGKGIQNTVSVPYGTKLAGYYLETPSYTSDGLLHEFQNWVAWTWKNNDDATMVVYTGDTMPASDVKMYPTYTFTGWMTDESGTTYYTKSAKTYFGEWATIDGVKYWFNAEGYIVKDIALIDGGYYAFDHESGKFLDDMTGIYEAVNGDKYYVVDGMAVENKGLVQDRFVLENSEIHTHYYYFGCDATGCTAEACTGAGQFKAQMGVRHWVENNNGMLIKGGYTFGADGVIEHTEDTDRHGIQTVNGVKFYLMDGVKVPYGLFKDRGYYYYARSSGALIVNESYWVSASKLNGLDLKAGTYNFDEEGRIVFGSEKTGIYAENDTLYYYVDGVKSYAGLIQYTGDLNNADGSVTENVYKDSWIYVNTQGEVKNDCKYWISKTNGHMIAMSYTFDVNGIMQDPAVSVGEAKNGVYAEGGSLYYYVNNVRNYAGLIQYTGDLNNADGSVTENVYNDSWIYVNTQGEVKNGCNYWISKNNGYMKNASYNFDENGIMTNPKPIA